MCLGAGRGEGGGGGGGEEIKAGEREIRSGQDAHNVIAGSGSEGAVRKMSPLAPIIRASD